MHTKTIELLSYLTEMFVFYFNYQVTLRAQSSRACAEQQDKQYGGVLKAPYVCRGIPAAQTFVDYRLIQQGKNNSFKRLFIVRLSR